MSDYPFSAVPIRVTPILARLASIVSVMWVVGCRSAPPPVPLYTVPPVCASRCEKPYKSCLTNCPPMSDSCFDACHDIRARCLNECGPRRVN